MDCVTDFMHACKHARTYARTHREHGILNMDPGFAYHFYGLTPYTSMIWIQNILERRKALQAGRSPTIYRVLLIPQWLSPPSVFFSVLRAPLTSPRPPLPGPFPKQQHLYFSNFSRLPTLNATQTSPSALLRPLWKPAQWHSQQPCVQHRTSAAHSKWCHCPPEQTGSRVQKGEKRKREEKGEKEGGGGDEKEKPNLWGRAGRVKAYVQKH